MKTQEYKTPEFIKIGIKYQISEKRFIQNIKRFNKTYAKGYFDSAAWDAL